MIRSYEKRFIITILTYLVLWGILWFLIAGAGAARDLDKLENLRRCKTLLQTFTWVIFAYLCWRCEVKALAATFLVIAAACFVVFLNPNLLVSSEQLMRQFQSSHAKPGKLSADGDLSVGQNVKSAEQLDRTESKPRE